MIPLLLAACAIEAPGSSTLVPSEPVVEPLFAPAARADLRLKRWRQISLDLQGALALNPDQICKETGLYDCTDLHAVPLGGLSVDNGLFEASNSLSVTTSLAIERLVLQACWRRVELDRAGEPVVFTALPLEGEEAEPAALRDQVGLLYQRLLARDPEPTEEDLLVDLHAGILEDGGGNAEWGLMTCFALGTSTEALFY